MMQRTSYKMLPSLVALVACVVIQEVSASPVDNGLFIPLDTMDIATKMDYANIGPNHPAALRLKNFESRPAVDESEFAKSNLPDEIFKDLRQTGCVTAPRDQGKCASSYIFSTLASWEYYYCRVAGKQIELSEQPALDCGEAYYGTKGCKGGDEYAVQKFFRENGHELREQYPYTGTQGTCPQDLSNQEGRDRMGWLKSNGPNELLPLRYEEWPVVLDMDRPIVVDVFAHPSFAKYTGGVDRAAGCGPKTGVVSMLLIGHGRENGREYWLFKNSLGESWGEGGYYKMDKRATEDCLVLPMGHLFVLIPDPNGFLMSQNGERNGTQVYSIPRGSAIPY